MVDIKEVLRQKSPEVDKLIEKYIHKQFNKENMAFTCGVPRYEYNL